MTWIQLGLGVIAFWFTFDLVLFAFVLMSLQKELKAHGKRNYQATTAGTTPYLSPVVAPPTEHPAYPFRAYDVSPWNSGKA